MSKLKDKPILIIIIGIILALVVFDAISGIVFAILDADWQAIYGNVISLFIVGFVVFIYRDIFEGGLDIFKKRRETAKARVEKSEGDIDLREAAIFSLSWSREIYQSIPEDRKRFIKASFILIGIALVLMIFQMESFNLFPVILIAAILLAGVNLIIWVVGSEREEKDRIRIELETARKMQLSLMPKQDPTVTGFDISGCCIPAHDVGGDLFDFVWSGKDEKKLCITIVDVSGKGMDAALTAVYTSGAIVSEAQHEEDVVTVIQNLNTAIFSRQNRSRFVSMLMAALDVNNKSIQYVNAGQSRPMLLRGQDVSVLHSTGPRFPLGVRKAPGYQSSSLQLRPGDSILLYTDGVTEAMNEHQEMYGEARLKEIFLELSRRHDRAAEMVEGLREAIMQYAGPEQQHDDLTIVVIRAS